MRPASYWDNIRRFASRELLIAVSIIAFTTLIILGLQIYAVRSLGDLDRQIAMHDQIKFQLDDLLQDLTDAETGQRGYILTGDSSYLSPYDAAIGAVPSLLAMLKTEIGPSFAKTDDEQIAATANAKFSVLNATLSLDNAGQQSQMMDLIESNQGQDLMNQLRTEVDASESRQSKLLTAEKERTASLDSFLMSAQIALTVLVLAAVLLVIMVYARAIANEKALEAAKDEFISLASHQLRTPTAGIRSVLAMMRNGDFGDISQQQEHFLGRALHSSDQMSGIIEDLLTTAQLEEGRDQLKKTNTSLQELIENLLFEQGAGMEAKHQHIDVKLPTRPVIVSAEPTKLRMAISNVLDNAHKYTPQGGEIKLALIPGNDVAILSITNSGPGISKRALPTIFERFVRANEGDMQKVGGSGLGLYLARRILRLHEGDIIALSDGRTFATFEISLPLADD